MVEVYKRHESTRIKPKNLKKEDFHLFSHELKKEIHSTHILFIRHAFILANNIFSIRDLRFLDSYTIKGRKDWRTYIKNLLLVFGRKNKLKKVLWVTDTWSVNFFHWFTDAIPRIFAARPFLKEHILLLPQQFRDIDYVCASLSLLEIKVSFYDPNVCQYAKEIILPSHTASTGNYNKEVIGRVRTFFFEKARGNNLPFRKVYISREKSAKRKVVNNESVQKLLTQFGFEVHFFRRIYSTRTVTYYARNEILSKSSWCRVN